jgi:plasmid rolling circle replication initiator protein Rep
MWSVSATISSDRTSQDNYIWELAQSQATLKVLSDRKKSGKERPWKVWRKISELLSHSYLEVNLSKAERLRGCATYLKIREYDDKVNHLDRANFCRVRLCPMCQWRRSLKVFGQMTKIMAHLVPKNYAYIFLTLTVRNCEGQDLSETVTHVLESWKRLMYARSVKQVSQGFYRTFEVTHNVDYSSKDFDTFHPHIHAILAVNTSYFTSRDYLSQAEWTSLWKDAARLDYDPMVNVKKVKGNTADAVAEVSKYATKADDFIIPSDWELTTDTVRILDEALNNRRFIAFGGAFKSAHKALNLDDADNGDLIHTGDEEVPESENYVLRSYAWHSGYGNYYRIKEG